MDRWEIESDSTLLPILDKAGGNPIDIVRDGEVVGQIVPNARHDRDNAQAAVRKLLSLRVDLKLAPGETISDLINEGRRY